MEKGQINNSRRMVCWFFMSATALMPCSAWAQQDDQAAAVRQAIDQARAAREAAEDALRRADEALKKAEAMLGSTSDTPQTAAVPVPQPMSVPQSFNDDAVEIANSNVEAMVDCDTAERIDTVVAGESVKDANDKKVYPINAYAKECLGLSQPAQYKSANLALAAGIQKNDGAIELTPSYTIRYAGRRAKYLKFSASGFAASDDDDANRTAFHDFTDQLSGDGFGLGAEFGSFAARDATKRKAILNQATAKARRACIAEKMVGGDLDADVPSAPRVDANAALEACRGAGFAKWLNENGAEYWPSTLGKLYEIDNTNPEFVAGGNFKYSWKTLKYLTPTLIAGLPATTTLAQLKDQRLKDEANPLLAKFYVGGSIASIGSKLPEGDPSPALWTKVGIGAVASLTYRREWQFSSDDKGQTLCGAEAMLTRCDTFNLNSPHRLTGWIPALSLNVSTPGVGYLPPLGFSVITSFDTVGDRFAIELPLYFGLESDKLSAGVKYFYRQGAVLQSGFKLDEVKGIALFIGSSFSLLNGR